MVRVTLRAYSLPSTALKARNSGFANYSLTNMRQLRLITLALLSCLATPSFQSQDKMDSDFDSFAASLGLSQPNRQTLQQTLQEQCSDPAAQPLHAACTVAKLAIGPDKVDQRPLNQTLVAENWYVRPYCPLPDLTDL